MYISIYLYLYIYVYEYMYICMYIYVFIAYTKKYLQSDWLRGVQYWPYLYCFQYLYSD